MNQTVIANLDVEAHWQRLLLPHRPMPQLGGRALERLSAFGTLLRAFGDTTDTLWTPVAVDPARLTTTLPVPDLISGPETRPASSSYTATGTAWGRIDETSARVNHRRFGFELSRQLDLDLEGSTWATADDELFVALARLGRWVAKAPLSAAGRDRVIGKGMPDEAERRRLRNLLARSDGVLVEPWLDRQQDFGVLLRVDDRGSRVVSIHRQTVDASGGFVGIEWHREALEGQTVDDVRKTAGIVGEALFTQGYRGPAGVDAWTWRRPDGAVVLNALGEINGRLSFGWVARQIGLRLGRERLRLRLGSGRQLEAAGQLAEALLLPDTRGRGAAWVE